jgi:hypothetical protein
MVAGVSAIVWVSKQQRRELRDRLSNDAVVVGSAEEFLGAPRDARTLSFIDGITLAALDQFAMQHAEPAARRKLLTALTTGPVVAVCDDALPVAVQWLRPRPWLSHVVSVAMLEGHAGTARLEEIMLLGEHRDLLGWLKPDLGRRVRLTHASRRGTRIDRMAEFFESQKVDPHAIGVLREAANDLLTNAFYEAPVAAGVQSRRIDRALDVALPEECACDISYGIRNDLAIIRVRDPFGALSHARLVEVLASRAAEPAAAALPPGAPSAERGLWRVLTSATIVAISVNANHHTQVLVAVPTRGQEPNAYAFHLFFKDGAKRGLWRLLDEDTGSPLSTTSVTLTLVE